MATKMTKKDWFTTLINLVNDSNFDDKKGAIDFLNHEVELVSKKSSKRTMTKTQQENLIIMENIKTVLSESGEPKTVSDLQTDIRLAEFSNQKLSALLRKMIENGEVIKNMDKKKAYFSLTE